MLRRGVVVLLVLAAAAAPMAGPTAAGADPVLVGCDQAAVRVQVTADTVLDPACTYTAGFDITTSDVTLDCRGARIRSPGDQGVGILVSTPNDVDLSDVTVTGCHVEGFGNSMRVRRDDARFLPAGSEHLHGTSDIVLTGNELSGSRGVGLYVDAYVSDVTVTDSSIHHTGSSGIYLEAGSRRNRIEGNRIERNGATENGAEGQTFEVGGTTVWYWGTGREGLSIDGSTGNVVRGNVFERNSFGAIFLYENCGEFASEPNWFERRTAAARNLIEGNEIRDEINGVWVGSRMGENTLPMDCSDPAYVDQPGRRVVLDHAPEATIRGNAFEGVTYGVRVEDDGAVVEDNAFRAVEADQHPVIIGTPDRTTVLDRPVTGTVLRDNRSSGGRNDSPYRWVHGHEQTVVEGNTADGEPAGLCEGEPPPRQLFVMVVAVAAPNPDGSEPTPPDLSIDTLGALPSCSTAPPSTTTSSTPVTSPAPLPATAVPGTPTYAG